MLGLGNAPDYGEMVNAAGFIAQVWYWLYIMIGFFVLMSALLAIVVAGYDAASARVDKHWRDPLANSICLMWRLAVASVSPAKAAGALPIMTDVEVLSALSGLTLAQHTQEAPGSPRRKLRQQASVNHLEKKLSSQGGTLVSDEIESPTSDRVVVIFGTKMTDVQLAHLFERVLVLERGSLSAMTLAVNVMMRLGVRSDVSMKSSRTRTRLQQEEGGRGRGDRVLAFGVRGRLAARAPVSKSGFCCACACVRPMSQGLRLPWCTTEHGRGDKHNCGSHRASNTTACSGMGRRRWLDGAFLVQLFG